MNRSLRQAIPRIEEVLEYVYDGLDQVLRSRSIRANAATLQGCLPLLLEEIPSERLVERIGQEQYERLRSGYLESSHLNLWYSMELRSVLTAITAARIRVMLLKGADVAATLYPRPELRHFSDIDLMVLPDDLPTTLSILERLGYQYHQEYRFEAVSRKRAGFVFVKKVPVGYIAFEVHTSPHSNELGASFSTASLWERARSIPIAGVDVCGMSLEDLLVYLCWHYRSHTFERLIWLYDIALLLLRYAHQLDWTLVHTLARQQGLMATVYFSVYWCQQLFHVALPPEARIEQFLPPGLMRWLIKRLIGQDLVAVLRRSNQLKRKKLQRLMVDDVPALFMVGLRLFFPSPTHLGRLYMEHSRFPLRLYWLYYFVHPFLVVKALLSNLFTTTKQNEAKN